MILLNLSFVTVWRQQQHFTILWVGKKCHLNIEQRLKIKLTTITLINHNTVYNERNYLTLYFFKSGQFEKSFKAIDCTASQLRGAGPKAKPEDTNFAFCQERESFLASPSSSFHKRSLLLLFFLVQTKTSQSWSPVLMFIIRLRDQLVREPVREGRWTLSEGTSTRWESARWQSNVYKGLSIYYVIRDRGGGVFPIYYKITWGRGGSPQLIIILHRGGLESLL